MLFHLISKKTENRQKALKRAGMLRMAASVTIQPSRFFVKYPGNFRTDLQNEEGLITVAEVVGSEV